MSLFKLLKRPVSQFNFNPNIIQRPKINLRTFATQVEQKDLLINKLEGSQEGITVFSLNRPQVKNALSKSLVYSLLEGIANLENDASTRVLILRSNVPGIFCAGNTKIINIWWICLHNVLPVVIFCEITYFS